MGLLGATGLARDARVIIEKPFGTDLDSARALNQAVHAVFDEDSFVSANALEGYERLILLAMIGDQALFTRSDGIERLWEISAPLLDNPPPSEPYEPGSRGPAAVDKLIAPYRWHLPEA